MPGTRVLQTSSSGHGEYDDNAMRLPTRANYMRAFPDKDSEAPAALANVLYLIMIDNLRVLCAWRGYLPG